MSGGNKPHILNFSSRWTRIAIFPFTHNKDAQTTHCDGPQIWSECGKEIKISSPSPTLNPGDSTLNELIMWHSHAEVNIHIY